MANCGLRTSGRHAMSRIASAIVKSRCNRIQKVMSAAFASIRDHAAHIGTNFLDFENQYQYAACAASPDGVKMKTTPRKLSAQLLVAAAVLTLSGASQAGPSNLWTDNHGHNSIAVPLDTPNQGIARARQLMHDQEHLRAARALHKVVTRWPNANQAHELLAEALNKLGETELAEKHTRLARGSSAGSEAISTVN